MYVRDEQGEGVLVAYDEERNFRSLTSGWKRKGSYSKIACSNKVFLIAFLELGWTKTYTPINFL